MKRRSLSGTLVLAALAVFAGACSGKATESSTAEPVHVIVGIRQNLSYAPFIIAQEEGYFAEQGLEVEFIPALRSAEALAAMKEGSLDVQAATLSIGVFNAIAQGEHLRIVANRGIFDPAGCSYMSLVVRKDLVESGEINGVADMAGRSVSGEFNSVFGYFLDQALQQGGLSLEDVVEMDLPTAAELDAMGDGTLDASLQTEPSATTFAQEGVGVELIGSQEVLPGFSWGTVMFGSSLLDEHPEAGKRFIVAYLKGVRQFSEGKTERNLEILQKATELDRDLLEASCWPSFSLDGTIEPQSVLAFEEWAEGRGLLDAVATVDQFWDPSFIEYANGMLEGQN